MKRDECVVIAGMPDATGAVDGAHVRNVALKEFEAAYVNRKRSHRIIVQVMFDARCRIFTLSHGGRNQSMMFFF